ncbi:threonylcarbamoyl-AMP synthase [Oxobacter pfennigii]|uniref:Threonylcarbamoyl-AMP synthase n=1 Tax=Oxobacter pfennigii TaxID=36849 RepID=A0A0P8YBY1_9CLOT|nr:L-threonylcarbamoyladenylate synthase [Oxobacter pfennigii]KPU44614.1 threonylcarbamoyl-AMP synthase [Oxobacter pfennigii]
METKVYDINENNPDLSILKCAAKVIKSGGTVVFPTETVYGLGADALNPEAVLKIFAAKGRPQDNPLIIHVAHTNIEKYVREVPKSAQLLMDKFWPGPLTIIMKKSDVIPDVITAGMDSVAIRMPSNKIAGKLIELSEVPIAAPSANISGRPSPTNIKHVIDDLLGRVDVILGGGRTNVGLESTVIDVTGRPTILRPGGITLEQLKAVLGEVFIDPAIMKAADENLKPRSPGMKYRHYSPKAFMYIVEGEQKKVINKINELSLKSKNEGLKAGILATDETIKKYLNGYILSMGSRENTDTIAASLFDRLREFDELNVDVIYAESIPEEDIGLAVMNRMKKAAGYNVIRV